MSLMFSIIIPTYNRAGFVKSAVESALAQSYQNFEVIVVDDGSKDNTESVLSEIKDPRFHYYKIENGERGRARNFGASVAKGDYLNFFDSDDVLMPDHLQEAFNVAEKNNFPAWLCLGYNIFSGIHNKVIRSINYKDDLNEQLIKSGNILSCNPVFIRKDIFEKNKFIEDRRLAGSEDYELWLRLGAQHRLFYSNKITSSLIEHDERSVLNFTPEKLINRISILHEYIFSDKINKEKYSQYRSVVESKGYSYIALHLVLSGYKLQGLWYLVRSIVKSPGSIFTRRFLAIIKHLLKPV